MKITENVYLLLHGAIRKDMGNGPRFYKALRSASTEELQWALARLSELHKGRYKWRYSYQNARILEIERELKKQEATP